MTAAGLDPESLTVVESYEHLPTSGGAAAEVALDANPRITALMCTADVLALSAMDYLRARGIYVPGQMTVTGFDGVPDALRARPDHREAAQHGEGPPRRAAAAQPAALGSARDRGARHRTGAGPHVRPAGLALAALRAGSRARRRRRRASRRGKPASVSPGPTLTPTSPSRIRRNAFSSVTSSPKNTTAVASSARAGCRSPRPCRSR